MQGLTITDKCCDDLLLKVDLKNILCFLENAAADTEWKISAVESSGGEGAEKLHELSDHQARLSSRALFQLASRVNQIIDGTFTGYRKGQLQPWIIIQAVDSSAYDVYCAEQTILDKIKQHFERVEAIPAAADFA